MGRLTALTKLLFWAALSLLPSLGWGQGYELSGESSLSGSFTLTLFDGDSSTHSFTAKSNKGRFFFAGSVDRPTLAMVEHPAMQEPLFFYIENSAVAVSVNASRPEQSVIRGSRSNSEYRYLMERFRGAADPEGFLRQYVRENSASIFVPFILYRQMPVLDEGVVRQLVGQLTGEAKGVYHYFLLRRWMRQTPAVAEGSEMPDFAFLDAKKNRRTFAAVRDTSVFTLVFFSAGWCDLCARQREQAARMLQEREAELLVINIDDNPNGWDAQYLKQLSVDHLPFMVLVDKAGVVVSRDLRVWELERAARRIPSKNEN